MKMRVASSVCCYGMSSWCLIETSFGSVYFFPILDRRESDGNSIPSILVAIEAFTSKDYSQTDFELAAFSL